MVFAGTASCLVLSNQMNILLLRKFSSQDIAIAAVSFQILICGFLFYTVQYNFQLVTMIIGMCLLMLFLHLISTNAMAIALNKIDVNLGIASAFMGSLRMALSAVVTFVLSYFLKDSAMPMVIAIFLMSLMSLFLQFRLRKQRA
jgi:DHA1 family bicyclomycin/chloramphenicol resistance-like MFS transporter